MSQVTPFTLAALTPEPWKNGGGATREIIRQPASDPFDWRASLADIDRDGPFSSFPGADRMIALVSGGGVRLTGGVDHRLDRPLAPFAFDGGAEIAARLLDGPCQVLNVMTRRGLWRSEMRALGRNLPVCRQGVLLVTAGHWRARDARQEWALAPGGGLWWQGCAAAWACESSDEAAAGLWVGVEGL